MKYSMLIDAWERSEQDAEQFRSDCGVLLTMFYNSFLDIPETKGLRLASVEGTKTGPAEEVMNLRDDAWYEARILFPVGGGMATSIIVHARVFYGKAGLRVLGLPHLEREYDWPIRDGGTRPDISEFAEATFGALVDDVSRSFRNFILSEGQRSTRISLTSDGLASQST